MTNEDNTNHAPISDWTLATEPSRERVTWTGRQPGAMLGIERPKPSHRTSRAARAVDVRGLVT